MCKTEVLQKQLEDRVPLSDRITQTVIDNLVKPRFVTIDDEDLTEYIYRYCKQLLQYSMDRHESKELAYAINLTTLDFVGAVYGDARTVDVDAIVPRSDDCDYVFIVLHNHPSNNTFSPKDLNTFFEVANVSILVVIGNKGALYVIEKTRAITRADFLEIKRIIIRYRNSENSFEEAVNELAGYGIVYSIF